MLDVGLTGKDWILESGADVVEIADLSISKASARPVRWVIAVPEESPIRTIQDLQGARIATELVKMTRRYLESEGVEAEVEYSWGSTEAKVRVPGLVDAIVELTETGSSLRANRLRVIETLFESTTRFIANREAWEDPWKREKARNIATLLIGAFEAEEKVGLKMNVRRTDLDAVVKHLPALNNPTISNLLDERWIAVEVIVDEKIVRDVIPALIKAGATRNYRVSPQQSDLLTRESYRLQTRPDARSDPGDPEPDRRRRPRARERGQESRRGRQNRGRPCPHRLHGAVRPSSALPGEPQGPGGRNRGRLPKGRPEFS